MGSQGVRKDSRGFSRILEASRGSSRILEDSEAALKDSEGILKEFSRHAQAHPQPYPFEESHAKGSEGFSRFLNGFEGI